MEVQKLAAGMLNWSGWRMNRNVSVYESTSRSGRKKKEKKKLKK